MHICAALRIYLHVLLNMERILTFKFVLDSLCLLKFQIDKDYIIAVIFEHMII